MWFRPWDFQVGPYNMPLVVVEGCPFYVGGAEFNDWAYMELAIDVMMGSRGRVFRYAFPPVHRCQGSFIGCMRATAAKTPADGDHEYGG
jgi:uncharacterized protein (DUF779 family)